MVLPCMRADAVLMLLPTISSNSFDSARSDSTASQGASLDAKISLYASLRSEVPQQPAASVQWDTGALENCAWNTS